MLILHYYGTSYQETDSSILLYQMVKIMAWIKPVKITTPDENFQWNDSRSRVSYVQDEKGLWYRAYGERTAGGHVLAEDKPFPHQQRYTKDKMAYEKKYNTKLFTISIDQRDFNSILNWSATISAY